MQGAINLSYWNVQTKKDVLYFHVFNRILKNGSMNSLPWAIKVATLLYSSSICEYYEQKGD